MGDYQDIKTIKKILLLIGIGYCYYLKLLRNWSRFKDSFEILWKIINRIKLSINIIWVISISKILQIATKGISRKLKYITEEVKTINRNSKKTTSLILKSTDKTILKYITLYLV